MHRRHFLQCATGSLALLSASSTVTAAEGPVPATSPQTHVVEMTDGMIYDPEVITIAPGDTVEWITVGQMGHSVTAYEDELPEGASYWASGEFDSEDDARSGYPEGNVAKGETYSYTFDIEGEYGYFCVPHETIQMVGKVMVQEGGAPAKSGGASATAMGSGHGEGSHSGGEDPEHMGVAFQAHWVGIATFLGIFASLVFTFFFLKYNETPHSGYPKQK
tara:strand:- start:6371 stop:7027 length:657 start_codon:yes stop_codon:yes gene_type:complete